MERADQGKDDSKQGLEILSKVPGEGYLRAGSRGVIHCSLPVGCCACCTREDASRRRRGTKNARKNTCQIGVALYDKR